VEGWMNGQIFLLPAQKVGDARALITTIGKNAAVKLLPESGDSCWSYLNVLLVKQEKVTFFCSLCDI